MRKRKNNEFPHTKPHQTLFFCLNVYTACNTVWVPTSSWLSPIESWTCRCRCRHCHHHQQHCRRCRGHHRREWCGRRRQTERPYSVSKQNGDRLERNPYYSFVGWFARVCVCVRSYVLQRRYTIRSSFIRCNISQMGITNRASESEKRSERVK